MCNIWRTQSDDMTLSEIEEKAKILRKQGIGYVFLQGGEPTMRSDIVFIVDIFIKELFGNLRLRTTSLEKKAKCHAFCQDLFDNQRG
jgi:molybdenum cofactor biosynthesis enzyme MoaA